MWFAILKKFTIELLDENTFCGCFVNLLPWNITHKHEEFSLQSDHRGLQFLLIIQAIEKEIAFSSKESGLLSSKREGHIKLPEPPISAVAAVGTQNPLLLALSNSWCGLAIMDEDTKLPLKEELLLQSLSWRPTICFSQQWWGFFHQGPGSDWRLHRQVF